ncbi:hypothetical protein D3C81_1978140 [compost metagenome]
MAGADRQCFRYRGAIVRRHLGRGGRLSQPVDSVLAVQTGHWQGRHGLRRLQAAGADRGLGRLASSAADLDAVVAGRGGGGVVHVAPAQPFDGYGDTFWSLSGHCGVDCRALG